MKWRLSKRLDVADEVVDLGARQGKIRHCAVRVRQKRAQLVGGQSAMCDRGKSWRTLWSCAGGVAADDMAMGAPLPGKLRALLGVGPDGVRGSQANGQYRQCRKSSV